MSLSDFDPHNVTGKYVLDAEGEPVEERDLFKWAQWMETRERVVLQTHVGRARVSTVFLGLNYSFGLDPSTPPVLWETMVFGKGSVFDGWGWRYTSKLDALAGHLRACARVERFDFPTCPRRLKKALRKRRDPLRALRPGERRRVERWDAAVARTR